MILRGLRLLGKWLKRWSYYCLDKLLSRICKGEYENGQYANFSRPFDAETANKSAQNGPFRFCSGIYERGKREVDMAMHWKKEMLS